MGRKRLRSLLTMVMITLLAVPAVAQAKVGATCATGMCPLGDETNLTPVIIVLLIAVVAIVLLLVLSKLKKKK
ncbi:MAG: hypothetical protein ACOYJU_03825 [Anaerovoracaceae bacterium]|jgi:hypothetical protein